MDYRLGLPMWGHKAWPGHFLSTDAQPEDYLAQYSRVFNTVEGNTTFYGIPPESSIAAWAESAPQGFRFSFKMPRLITHDLKLQRCELSVKTFFQRLEPLMDRIGPVMIQLPASTGPSHLPVIEDFIKQLPCHIPYALEVRHPKFFDASVNEKALVDLLKRYRIDRVCFDSRALFASASKDEFTLGAQKKKPKLPVHAMATGQFPMVRFVGDTDYAANDECLDAWISKICQWIEAGKEPYVFMHMANNAEAPTLAKHFHQRLQKRLTGLPDLADFPCLDKVTTDDQMDLF